MMKHQETNKPCQQIMLVEIASLWPHFLQAQNQGNALVLATLLDTAGSSYKKAGAMLLVTEHGKTHGLISGGCLEADVAEHAREVFTTGVSKTLHYDLSDDSIFGMGAGCDGEITLLLQKLTGDYRPFSLLEPDSDDLHQLWLNTDASIAPLGTFVHQHGNQIQTNLNGPLVQKLKAQCTALNYLPRPRVAVCGIGSDALPLLKLMQTLHWQVCAVDHRPAAIENLAYLTTTMNEWLKLPDRCDAVVIMSHNIDRDALYLQSAIKTKAKYIGLLGPPARRDKVLSQAGLTPNEMRQRLHAPVGLDLGGRLPENIAVSIVAELQQHFFKKEL